jgi:ABC-type Zn uptake system ZnuABC Zn-binding protein ZnuA
LFIVFLTLLLSSSLAVAACGDSHSAPVPERAYTATINPVAEILRELVGGRAQVHRLLTPGASPHAYEARPSDVRQSAGSIALFYVAPHLDEWATELEGPVHVALLDLVPPGARLAFTSGAPGAGETGEPDPHFWTDPLTVRDLLPALADTLCGLDPGGCSVYRLNAQRFGSRLSALDGELRTALEPLSGQSVLLAQPFFRYFLERYHLKVLGVLEPAPGKEPTPSDLERMIRTVLDQRVTAILAQPQLPARSARVVAEATGVPVLMLDPLGSVEGRQTYEELLRHNARTLVEALQ